MMQRALSERIRDAALRIGTRVPLHGDLPAISAEQVSSDAWLLCDLAEEVAALEERLRPRAPREAQRRRGILRRLRAWLSPARSRAARAGLRDFGAAARPSPETSWHR